jgi:hypothetical protein
LRPVRHDPGTLLPIHSSEFLTSPPALANVLYLVAEIHGSDGLGGVEGLLSADDSRVQAKVEETKGQKAVHALTEATQSLPEGQQLSIVATGALTNIALFVALYPELVRDKVSQICLMGGAEGRGNRSPTAEFNILIDPEAAAIVFDAEVKVVIAVSSVLQKSLMRGQADFRRPILSHSTLRTKLSSGLTTINDSSRLVHLCGIRFLLYSISLRKPTQQFSTLTKVLPFTTLSASPTLRSRNYSKGNAIGLTSSSKENGQRERLLSICTITGRTSSRLGRRILRVERVGVHSGRTSSC